MIRIAEGSKIYIDTNVFICFIEKVAPFHARAQELFWQMSEAGALLLTSEITVAECLHRPWRMKDRALIETYELLFERSGDIRLIALDGGIAKRAVETGAPLGLKLVDAIHYVSALEEGCDLFVSSDSKFRPTDTMDVLAL